jgi:hypothetical protein
MTFPGQIFKRIDIGPLATIDSRLLKELLNYESLGRREAVDKKLPGYAAWGRYIMSVFIDLTT